MINRKRGAILALLIFSLFLVPNFASAKYKLINPGLFTSIDQFAASGTDFYALSYTSSNGTDLFEKHGNGAWALATSSALILQKPFIDGTKVYIPATNIDYSQSYLLTKDSAVSPWVLTPLGSFFSNHDLMGVFFRNGIGYGTTGDGFIMISTSTPDSWSLATSTGDSFFSGMQNYQTFNSAGDQTNQIIRSDNNNFYYTHDGGVTWQSFSGPALVSNGSENDYISNFVFDNSNAGWVTVSSNHGIAHGKIFYTPDGVNWTKVYDANTPYMEFHAIQNVGNNIVAVANKYGGALTDTVAIEATSTTATSSSTVWNTISDYQPNDNNSLNGVDLKADGTGYFYRESSLIGATTDGANTWSFPFNSQQLDIKDISFIDNNTGYSVGGFNQGNAILHGEAYKTTDGGNTWNQIYATSTNDLWAVYATGTDVWVSGDNGFINHSSDGGQTWSQSVTGYYSDINALYFSSTSTGLYSAYSKIAKTTDGGQTWNQVLNYGPNDFQFPSSAIGYAVGASGGIKKTSNGGDNWVSQTSGTTSKLNSVYFVDNNTGWAVGVNGTIVSTTNGGANWTATTSAICPSCTFTNVAFSSPTNGRIIGLGGSSGREILRTFDGGVTWQGDAVSASNTVNYDNAWVYDFFGLAAKPNGDFFFGGNDGLLLDYDATVGITASPSSFPEGSSTSFTFDRGTTIGATTINYQINGLNSSNTSDSLIFSTTIPDGSQYQTVNIGTLDNHIAEADKPFNVSVLPGEYAINPSATTTVDSFLLNTDVASIVATPVVSVTEGGATGTLAVVLTSQPTGSVTLSLDNASSTDYTLGTTTLSFDNTNWNVPQNVDVLAVDDQVYNGTRHGTTTISVATSTAAEYPVAMSTTSLITIQDNETPPVSSGGGGGGGGYVPQPLSGNYQLSINQGAAQASSTQVTLFLTATSDIKKMALSNTPDFLNSSQEDFSPTKLWTLSSGDGLKTVYAKLYNNYGVSSNVISASITLNTNSSTSTPEATKATSTKEASTKPASAPAQPIYVKSSDLLKLKFGDYTFKDTDKDGLSDQLETLLGTDPKKMDTDKDGYSDGTEIANGYDPLTTGKITPEEQAIIKAHPQWIDTDLNGIPDSLQKALGFSLRATKNKKDGASLQKGYNPFTKTYLQPSASLIKRLKNQTLIEVKTGIALHVDAKGIVSLK